MTSRLGDSRVSWTFALYAMPRSRRREPLTGLPLLVQRVGDLADDEARHARVDLVRRVDQARRVAVLAHACGEELRHDRDAVAAEAGPGVVREERERLARRRLDHFPRARCRACRR